MYHKETDNTRHIVPIFYKETENTRHIVGPTDILSEVPTKALIETTVLWRENMKISILSEILSARLLR